MTREGIKQNEGLSRLIPSEGVRSFAVDTGMSIADNIARLPFGNAGLAFAGGGAGVSGTMDALGRGANSDQAFLSGAAQGAAEAFFEKFSLEGLRRFQPGTVTSVRDQDSGDCVQIKSALKELVSPYGRQVLIRIVCRELESWYFGDLKAVSNAYGLSLGKLAKRKKYRNPDLIENAKEELRKLIPRHQQLDGARRIAAHMDIEHNTSASFQIFVSGVRKMAESECKQVPYNHQKQMIVRHLCS